ncbi:hypothetical protein DFH06DRAFT_1334630 [Mycena polygramma]|nr:hypothetical protein DFH06DRAFT_1334630 [Mycena polygramma]
MWADLPTLARTAAQPPLTPTTPTLAFRGPSIQRRFKLGLARLPRPFIPPPSSIDESWSLFSFRPPIISDLTRNPFQQVDYVPLVLDRCKSDSPSLKLHMAGLSSNCPRKVLSSPIWAISLEARLHYEPQEPLDLVLAPDALKARFGTTPLFPKAHCPFCIEMYISLTYFLSQLILGLVLLRSQNAGPIQLHPRTDLRRDMPVQTRESTSTLMGIDKPSFPKPEISKTSAEVEGVRSDFGAPSSSNNPVRTVPLPNIPKAALHEVSPY